MARYTSGDEQNKRIGISSFSEDKTSLVVIGKVGINTEDAMDALHVEGNAFISGSIGIGTTNPDSAVMPTNNTIINVGIVTAREIYGELKDATGIVTTAYNVAGGGSGQLLYQHSVGLTSFLDNGSTGFALISQGAGNEPVWAAAAPAGAIEGILLFDEGGPVGMGTSFGALDFRGSSISVDGTSSGGVATVTATGNFGTEFISGAGITVTGVSTFSGGIQAVGFISALPGFGLTYFGDGSQLDGAGVWQTNSAGINTISNVGIGTTTPLSAFQVGSASSSFSVVSTASSIQVGIGTTDPGKYTLEVKGDTNIDGDLNIEGSKVGTIAMIVALGGF